MERQQKSPVSAWNSGSVGKPWQHRFFYALIRLGGRHVAYCFMYFVVLWYVLFYPPLHKKCQPYLTRRFPGKRGYFARFISEYHWITSLGKNLIDRAAFGILGPQSIKFEISAQTPINELFDKGNGLIILSAHTGCWQVGFSAMKFLKGQVHIVMYRDQYDIDKQYFEHDQLKPPFDIIDPAGYLGGTLQMAGVIQDGQIVGLMGDRIFGDDAKTVAVDFLGGRIDVPATPYRLAAMRGTPIAVVFSHKKDYSGYMIEVAGVIQVPQGIDRTSQAYVQYAQRFADLFAGYVQKHPFDFFNFYDMWKAPDAG